MRSSQSAVAPNLSPATVRQRESYLKKHVIPRFGDAAVHTMALAALQQFATDMRKVLSHNTVVNLLGTIFAILHYAEKTGTQVPKVSFADLILGEASQPAEPFFTKEQAARIIDPREATRIARLPPRLSDRASGQSFAAARAPTTDASCGRAYHAANLREGDFRESTGSNGEDRQRNQYIRAN